MATPLGAALLVWGLLFAYLSSPAYADTTFVVNSTGDENDLDFPGGTFDGSSDAKCDVDSAVAGEQCTLRAAIQEANVTAGDDTIDIEVTGTVNLTGALPTLDSTTPDSDLTTATLKIEGPGADQFTVRRDTGGLYSIFQMDSFNTVSISGMTITNGDSDRGGGGIHTFGGDLTVTDSTISGNIAAGVGGGILSRGDLTVINSTISGNTATGGCCGNSGGGIFSDTSLSGSSTRLL